MPLREIARFVMSVSSTSGVLVGLIAGVGGSFFTQTRPALADFAANAFLLLGVLLPAVFYLRLVGDSLVRERGYGGAALVWLPALFLAVVFFTIPVVMIPLILGRGVTLANSAEWYGAVYDLILGWRLLVVAVLALVGCLVAVYSLRR